MHELNGLRRSQVTQEPGTPWSESPHEIGKDDESKQNPESSSCVSVWRDVRLRFLDALGLCSAIIAV